MQQQDQPIKSVEQVVGEMVADLRGRKGWTQRQFAEYLTEAGLAVDASAVSRIEKGTRALRLSEAMTLAATLGVELDHLTDRVQTPETYLRDLRQDETVLRRGALGGISEYLQVILWTRELLREQPELLKQLTNKNLGEPTADGFLDWEVRRILSEHQAFAGLFVTSASEVDDAIEFLARILRETASLGREPLAVRDFHSN